MNKNQVILTYKKGKLNTKLKRHSPHCDTLEEDEDAADEFNNFNIWPNSEKTMLGSVVTC